MWYATLLEEIDSLNNFENERWPQIFKNGRQPDFLKMEDDLNILVNGRHPQFFQMEDNLNILLNGRRPEFFQMEDDLQKIYETQNNKKSKQWLCQRSR